MSTVERIAKNIGTIFVGSVFTKLFDFIIIIYLAKHLGNSGFGIYSFVLTYIFFFNVLPTLGINKIMVREIARDDDIAEKIIGNMVIIRILLSLFAIILCVIVINLLNYSIDTRILVYIASLTILFSSIGLTFASIFQARLKMKYSVAADVSGKIILVILILTIVSLQGSLVHIITAIVISSFIIFLILFIFSRKFVKPKFEFDFPYSIKILKSALPLALTVVFVMIYNKIDILMLSLMKTFTDVGYYSSAYKLIEALNIIPMALMMSLFPLMSKYYKNSKESLTVLYERSFRLLLMIGLPIAVGTTLFSKDIIHFIFGNEFLPSASALSILIWAEVILFINLLFINVVISMDKQIITTYITGIMAIVNIVLNLILIPQFSYIGASIATVFTEALGALIIFYYIYTTLIPKSFTTTILKLISVNIIFYAFLAVFTFMSPHFIIPVSIIFYFFLVVAFNLITREEMVLIRATIKV